MSRIDMIAPSTTTPATRRTSLSSFPDADPGGTEVGWGGVWVVTGPQYGTAGPRRTSILPPPTSLSSQRRLVRASGQQRLDRLDDAGVVGHHGGVEPGHDVPGAVDQELLEVPGDVAVLAGLVGDAAQLVVPRVPPGAVAPDLLGHGEGPAVRRGEKLRDLLSAAGLLPAELVAG